MTTATTGPDLRNRFVYMIVESSKDENGYIPVMVVEDDPTLYAMLGNGECATPWYWGHTREDAQRICDKVNLKMGISKEEAAKIISSSIKVNRNLR